jgi:hypothetical protein
MCSVTSAWLAKPWKNSWRELGVEAADHSRLERHVHRQAGRPEKSITTRDSASSSGT